MLPKNSSMSPVVLHHLPQPSFSFFFFCCSSCFFFPLQASSSSAPQLNLWPFPTNVSWPTHMAAFLSPSFQILSPGTPHKHLRSAMRRYAHLVFSEKHHPIVPLPVDAAADSPQLQSLTVHVSRPSTPLQHGADESYSLSIPPGGASAHLRAETAWGAMRGLETFSQLVWGDPPRVPSGVDVHDRPIFPHRGLLLDTSRNYYPVEDILRTVRAMAANKLNVFHWHITDSHSFPIVLPSEPGLAANGSYGPGMVYTPADVKKVVEFGMRHGVRILPEIDTPGHAASWAGAHPEIVTCKDVFWLPPGARWEDRLASEPGAGQLNPLHPRTYQVVRNVINDAASLFPEGFFHAGADEVTLGCWKTDPAIRQFLTDGGAPGDLLETFVNSTLPYIASLNRTAVYWEDVLLDDAVRVRPSALPPETTVLQTWRNGPNSTKAVTAAGYRAIVSSSDFYYLDCGHGDFLRNDSRYDRQTGDDPGRPFNYGDGSGGSWCGPFKTWQRVYDCDITYGLSEEEAGRVLGGEVALWSEQADAAVLDGWVWPRASAMAEALWSGNRDGEGRKRYAEAAGRLGEWRRRMVARGVRAEPIEPLWCASRPGMCNAEQ